MLNAYTQTASAAQDRNPEEWEACRTYNDALALRKQEALSSEYESRLQGGTDGAMAIISIPCIDVLLPVYHYSNHSALDHGAGHMEETSLPTGGINTHCAITAHTGSTTKRLFSDLNRMKIGDLFYLYVLDECHAYRVVEIATVMPHETERLEILPGRDLCTLVTCTPYGVNSHRLLVTGERDRSAEEDGSETKADALGNEADTSEKKEDTLESEADDFGKKDAETNGSETQDTGSDPGADIPETGGTMSDWTRHYLLSLLYGSAVLAIWGILRRRRRRE